jgi:aspartate carbamoyltransferase catalytic subunit
MNLIGLRNTSREELLELLDLADDFIDEDGRACTPDAYEGALADESVGLLFFEPSTRTRVSFEYATHKLGGYSLFLSEKDSSVKKGETVLDTCRNLVAMGFDGLVIRHADRHLPFTLSDALDVSIINAGNGSGEHPTQALLDALTLRRTFGRPEGDLSGKRIAIIGDVVHSRVARSDVFALKRLGAEVVLAGPSMLLPNRDDDEWDAEQATSRAEALDGADAVIMLRVQTERIHGDVIDTNTFIRNWGIDRTVVEEEMEPHARVLHPGPVVRGVELTGPVADGPRSLILDQVGIGVAVRQAVLLECLTS